jgi:hypothetical protein
MLGNLRGFSGFAGSLRHVFGALGATLFVASACGDSEKDPLGDGPGPGARGGSGGFGGSSGSGAQGGSSGTAGTMGGEGGMDGVDPLAPTVEITSPEHLDDPNDDVAVLVDPEVEVVCEARQSTEPDSEPVNAATVLLQMLDADGEVVKEDPGVETEPGVFSAPFILTDLPNGRVSFRCLAADTSDPPRLGSDTNATFVDHGPAIEVTSPEDGSSHSAQGAVQFSFTVTPDPLVDDDPGSEIDDVTLVVLDVDIPLDEEDGVYTATVDFTDTEVFPPATDVQADIRARNIRLPERGVRRLTLGFVLDSVGPEIVVTAPAEDDVVGGDVTLEFTVTDALSEIDSGTVSVRLNTLEPELYPMGRWTRNGDDFTYTFNSTIIDGDTAQTTINIEATDVAGNRSAGSQHIVWVDNTPPIVDLDPPLIRELNDASDPAECSVAFDPVGDGAANDLQTVQQAQMFRAVVWSLGNGVPGQTVVFQAATKEDSVILYLLENPSSTNFLLSDTNGDGVCDDIVDRVNRRKVDLHPIARTGEAWFGSMSDEPLNSPTIPGFCGYRQPPQTRPDTLCLNRSDIGRVISHARDGAPPVIYARGSMLTGTGAACTGTGWEIGQQVTPGYEGWVCVAARAEDVFDNGETGNHAVSRPLRLCYDDGEPPAPDCSGTPPTCMAPNCMLPPTFFQNFVYNPIQ